MLLRGQLLFWQWWESFLISMQEIQQLHALYAFPLDIFIPLLLWKHHWERFGNLQDHILDTEKNPCIHILNGFGTYDWNTGK